MDDDTTDMIGLVGGTILACHGPSVCAGKPCCIHNPSAHPLRAAPLHWRGDMSYMERICRHGWGHPDPDDIMVRRYGYPGAHKCDGCCAASSAFGATPQ